MGVGAVLRDVHWSGDCVCTRGGGRTPRSCPNPGSWANLQARAPPEGALLLADQGRPVSAGLLPRNSAHSPRSQRPARGEVARTRSWPASEASWLVFSDEAELVSREVAGLELGGRDRSLEEGMHLGLRPPPPPTPSVRRVGQRRDSCRTFASPPGGGASAKPGLL